MDKPLDLLEIIVIQHFTASTTVPREQNKVRAGTTHAPNNIYSASTNNHFSQISTSTLNALNFWPGHSCSASESSFDGIFSLLERLAVSYQTKIA
jgi:hypothetical protein